MRPHHVRRRRRRRSSSKAARTLDVFVQSLLVCTLIAFLVHHVNTFFYNMSWNIQTLKNPNNYIEKKILSLQKRSIN